MRHTICFLAVLSIVACVFARAGTAQILPTAEPGTVGLSSENLARIAPAIESWIAQGRIAGAVTLIARHGKVVHVGAHGMADREAARPMSPETIFRIMSMTKPVTSTAVMMLHEEGRFLLDTPVSAFIPEFSNQQVIVPGVNGAPDTLVPAKRAVTIRDLLNHTAGLSYGSGPHKKYYAEANIDKLTKPAHPVAEVARALGKTPLLFEPGTDFMYSYCDDVLGYVVELVSGMSFDRFCEERIFTPLGMTDTFFYVPTDKMNRLAGLYLPGAEGKLVKRSPTANDTAGPGERNHFSGGGGLYSTVGDYARFCQMLLNGGVLGEVRIVSRKTVEAMTTNSIGALEGKVAEGGDKWGLGSVSVCTERKHVTGVLSQGSYMKSGAHSTYFWIDPSEDMFGIYLSQTVYGMELPNLFSAIAATAIED